MYAPPVFIVKEVDEDVYIHTPTQKVSLGSQSEVGTAAAEISRLTGGSSGGGAYSLVFGVMDAQPEYRFENDRHLAQLVGEARGLRAALDDDLGDAGRAFLDRLAALS